MKKLIVLTSLILANFSFADSDSNDSANTELYCANNQTSLQTLFNNWSNIAGYNFKLVNKDYYYSNLNQDNLDRERVYVPIDFKVDPSICSDDLRVAINSEVEYLRENYPNDYFVVNFYDEQKTINLEIGDKNRFN